MDVVLEPGSSQRIVGASGGRDSCIWWFSPTITWFTNTISSRPECLHAERRIWAIATLGAGLAWPEPSEQMRLTTATLTNAPMYL